MATPLDWMFVNSLMARAQAPQGAPQSLPPEVFEPDQPVRSEMPAEQAAQLKAALEKKQAEQQFPTFALPGNMKVAGMSVPAVDPDTRARIADQERMYKQQFMQAQNSIDQQDQAINDLARIPSGLDMSGFAGLADKWTGGGNQISQAAASARGMSPEEKAQILAKLRDQQVDNKSALAKTVGDRLSQLENNKAQFRLADMMSKNSRFGMSQDLKKEDNLRNDITKSVLQPVLEDTKQMEIMDQAFASGDSQKIGNVLSLYARSISGEKGVLTDQDISRVMPRNYQGTVAQFISYLSSTPSADIPKEYTVKMRELIDLTKEKLAKKYKTTLDSKKKIYSSGSYSGLMGKDEVGDVIFKETEGAVNSFYVPKAEDPNSIEAILKRGKK